MGLYERLLRLEPPKIPVHAFIAALGELERGKTTLAALAVTFGLSAAEELELQTLVGRVVTPLESIALGSAVTLTNIGTTYDATTASQGLGFVRIQTAGITGFELVVRTNKVGTGTQSWQLWNETDGTEATVIDDAGATGIKEMSVLRTFTQPLGAGIKLLRIRAKSTVGADDPVYLGASLLVRRVERLTSTELHEVLLLAEHGLAGYTTTIDIKARLGV